MKCNEAIERFSEYLDGALPQGERAAVEAHVGRCAACRAELDALRRTVQAAAGLPHRRAPAGFASRVMSRIEAGETAGQAPGRRIITLWPRLAAVAALLLVAAGVSLFIVTRQPEVHRFALETGSEEKGRQAIEAPSVEPAAAPAPEAAAKKDGAQPAEGGPGVADDKGKESHIPLLKREKRAEIASHVRELSEIKGDRTVPDEMMDRVASGDEAAPEWLEVAGQAAAAPEPHQVLLVRSSDPLALAARTVKLAEVNGISDVQLGLPGGRGGQEEVEVELAIPVEKYETFLTQLSEISPPDSQGLSNTEQASRAVYFRDVLDRYEMGQKARYDRKEDMARRGGLAGGSLVVGSTSAAAAPSMAEAQDSAAPVDHEKPALAPAEEEKRMAAAEPTASAEGAGRDDKNMSGLADAHSRGLKPEAMNEAAAEGVPAGEWGYGGVSGDVAESPPRTIRLLVRLVGKEPSPADAMLAEPASEAGPPPE